MPALVLHRVSKVFSGKHGKTIHAVRALDLTVAHRELATIVGPSGSGKTTVLRLVAGLETLSEGRITIDGRRLNPRSLEEREIAMVFQNHPCYPHLMVAENLSLVLKLRRVPRPEIARRIEPRAGPQITAGVPSDAIPLQADGTPADGARSMSRAPVLMIEPWQNESWVYVGCRRRPIVVHTHRAQALALDQEVAIAVDPERVRWFDSHTGQRPC